MNSIKVLKGNRNYSLGSISDPVKMIINNNLNQGVLHVEDIPDTTLSPSTWHFSSR